MTSSTLSESTIRDALAAMRGKRVVVAGDFMLDRYIWGAVRRISPEAPVPVVEVNEDAERPGGAGNVVLNLAALGARCEAVGLIGDDDNGSLLRALLAEQGAGVDGLIADAGRPTTVKTRVIAGNQHLLRVDREHRTPAGEPVQRALLEQVREAAANCHAIVLQDYNKGMLSATLIRGIIEHARHAGIPVAVDPKADNFFAYRGATLFKPNRREAENALARTLETDADVHSAGRDLLKRMDAELVLLTRGSQGMTLFGDGDRTVHIETRPRRISDVSGAGDTVISTMTLALAAGIDPETAALLATRAAEYVVGRVGVVPVTAEALLATGRD
ncbi:MAG: Bifunctional protein HldE [Calditrichaeota bacterium]|nr:Bifunctional protein HldE [Calditrichota bacterium]